MFDRSRSTVRNRLPYKANIRSMFGVTPSMSLSIERVAEQRRVRVWFGAQPICDYCGDIDDAARYADAMRRRFVGLRVTNEAEPVADGR